MDNVVVCDAPLFAMSTEEQYKAFSYVNSLEEDNSSGGEKSSDDDEHEVVRKSNCTSAFHIGGWETLFVLQKINRI